MKLLRSGSSAALTEQASNLVTIIKYKCELQLVKRQFTVSEERFNRLYTVEDQILESLVKSACSEDELISKIIKYPGWIETSTPA